MNKKTWGMLGIIVLVVIGFYFIFSEKPVMTNAEATQIVQHQYVKNPTFAIALRDNGDYFIVTSIRDGQYNDPRIIVLKQVADLWQEQSSSPQIVCSTLECPADAAKVELGGKSYVYFTTESSGSAAGSITFNLLSPSEMHLYSMSVSGGNGNLNQPGIVTDDVKNNQDIYNYLTQQIAASPKVAHTSQENLNVNDPTNAVQKWQLDNENIWTAMKNYAAPVKFTYYDANLLDQWSGTTITGSAENSQYKITSIFKGVTIGYDKSTSKYFVVWVPSDMYEWPTDTTFIDQNTLQINSANSGPSLTVHLDTDTITSP